MSYEKKVIAHRGLHTKFFENTLEAIAAAGENCEGVEFDVQLTQCGEAIVFHDDDLRRINGLGVPINQLRYDVLSELALFIPGTSHPLHIPKLVDVMDCLPESILINIELKSTSFQKSTIARRVIPILRKYPNHQILISSFNPYELFTAAALSRKTIPFGLLTDPESERWLARGWSTPFLKPLGLSSIHPHFSQVTYRFISWAKDLKLKVYPWTVNDPQEIDRLLRLGVDGVITDDPALARDVIDQFFLDPFLRAGT